MTARERGEYLRHGTDANLRRRRAVIALSLLSASTMGFVSLYQIGLIKHLPDPPLAGFDAERVNGSPEAYSLLKTPDAMLGFISYGVTAALAAAGGAEREKNSTWLPLALAGKAMADAAVASMLTWQEAVKYKAFCIYCLITTIATLGVLPLVWPEARQSLRHLFATPNHPLPALIHHSAKHPHNPLGASFEPRRRHFHARQTTE